MLAKQYNLTTNQSLCPTTKLAMLYINALISFALTAHFLHTHSLF